MKAHYNSVIEGIKELAITMKNNPDMMKMSSELHKGMISKIKRSERLFSQAKQTGHLHTAWIHMAGVSHRDFYDSLFWYGTYETLAQRFDVPMSWIACTSIRPMMSSDSGRWRCETDKEIEIFDDEGNCVEMIYAAHLDGVAMGLISNEHFPFDRPEVIKNWTSEANNHLNTIAKVLDITVDEILEGFKKSDEFELFTPYEDDDSLNK